MEINAFMILKEEIVGETKMVFEDGVTIDINVQAVLYNDGNEKDVVAVIKGSSKLPNTYLAYQISDAINEWFNGLDIEEIREILKSEKFGLCETIEEFIEELLNKDPS